MSGAASAQYGVTCSLCNAEPWEPCRSLTTGRITDTHANRLIWASILKPAPRPEDQP